MLNMADTLMIGRLGSLELASVGIANQYFFFFSLVIFGINAGVSMFISQFWGKKDTDNIKKMTGIGLFMSLIASIIFSIAAICTPEKIMGIFNGDASLIKIGSEYLTIVAFSYIATAVSLSFAFASRSIENSFLPMMASIAALIMNMCLNYVLIFGKLGMPQLGVKGAAIATVTARMVEALVVLIYIYHKKIIIAVKFNHIFNFNWAFYKMALSGVIPILANEIIWGLGNISYNIIYARMGVESAATIQITTTILNLLMIVVFSLGNSAMVIVGKEIGAGNIEKGKEYGKDLYKMALKVGSFIGIFIFFSASYMLIPFNVEAQIIEASEKILKINSGILLLRTYNFMMIVGILRGGGDAKYGVVLQGIVMWFVGIPISYFAAFVLKLPIYQVFAFVAVEEIIKVIFISIRFKSGKWIKDITKNAENCLA
jgi:putative MATE family efflux protein